MNQSLPLDVYDDIPRSMKVYLRNYGWHFNSRLLKFALSKLSQKGASGKPEKIEPYTKEQVDELLNKFGVKLERTSGIDYVYVANFCKAKFFRKSVSDESHLAFFVRDVMDDPSTPDGLVLRMFCVQLQSNGEMFDWADMIE